ncbi:MAG: 50S ribosomal protein L23 [bacterium]|nr:50S ribosomal protein L23 [bacterium]
MLLRPQFSEKSNSLSNKGKYVFIVDPAANKPEIKKAVEKVYDVHVTDVNVLRVSGKKRRYGRAVGQTRSWKKAVVTLKSGEKIEGISQVI